MASTIADAEKIKKIIALVNNLYTSKFNSGAIIGISICDRKFTQLEWKLLGKIFLSWIFTPIITQF